MKRTWPKVNYLKKFVDYSEEHSIWFECYPGGYIGILTDCDNDVDFKLEKLCVVGSQLAYDQLVSEHKKALKEEGIEAEE